MILLFYGLQDFFFFCNFHSWECSMSFQYQILFFLIVTYNASFCIKNGNNFLPPKATPQFSAGLEKHKGSMFIEFHSLLHVKIL